MWLSRQGAPIGRRTAQAICGTALLASPSAGLGLASALASHTNPGVLCTWVEGAATYDYGKWNGLVSGLGLRSVHRITEAPSDVGTVAALDVWGMGLGT